MKKKDLEKQLSENGANFSRHGGNHDIWTLANGKNISIPRHKEINERLAKAILKKSLAK